MREITVETGALRGVETSSGMSVFKNIPFAAPPVGDLRWKAPAAADQWTGVRDATEFGPGALQIPRQISTTEPTGWTTEYLHQGPTSEDCLTLNVWTPARDAGERLPVIVWIHGGGFSQGSARVPIYDMTALAAEGVVVVTIQYRLGILGFLATPELSTESPEGTSGNYGLLDQIAALEWVQRNIAAFGGDPGRVTMFGQSAGAGSVQFLSLSPLARGLFHRGIADNGTLYARDPLLQERSPIANRTLTEAENAGRRYLRGAGIDSLARLRSLTSDEILQLPAAPFPPAYWSPTIDGKVLPHGFEETYARAGQADIPMIVGWTNGFDPTLTITVSEYESWAAERFGDLLPEFLRLYPADDDATASIQSEAFTQDCYRATLLLWTYARSTVPAPTYVFTWTHPTPGMEHLGAFPSSELPYVMGTLSTQWHPYTEEDFALARMLRRYWVNFAATGDPNGAGLACWPATSADGRVIMRLDSEVGAITAVNAERLAFIDKWFSRHSAC